MSAGERLPHARAKAASDYLMKKWGMSAGCLPVGSIRRERPDVGDIEFIAPMPEGRKDELFERIEATTDGTGGTIFGEVQLGEPRMCRSIRGLKRGFIACSLECRIGWKDGVRAVPVQIFRYVPDNRGWIELMRTGPADFGRQLLIYWRRRYRIADGQEASVLGHLVDQSEKRVPTPTERSVFELCGIEYVEPRGRDAWIERVMSLKKG